MQSTNQVRLDVTSDMLKASAEDKDTASSAQESLKCSYDGQDISIGFNARFLIESLNALDTEEIEFKMLEPNKSALVLPIKHEEKEEEKR